MPSTSSCTPISPSHFPSSYHPALHYRPSVPSDYLPDDEYRYLVKQQICFRLETRFAQPSRAKSRKMRPKTAYQKQGSLSRSRRAKISGTAYATRTSLGLNFDFTDERFDKMQAVKYLPESLESSNQEDQEENKCGEPVPAPYIAECYEEMRYLEKRYKGRQNQHRSNDSTSSAPRRTHSSTHSDTNPLPPRESISPRHGVLRRERDEVGFEVETAYGPRPQPQSKFSWNDSLDENADELRKRSLWTRARRSWEAARVTNRIRKSRTW